MILYILYDKENGEIVGHGDTDRETNLAQMAVPGIGVRKVQKLPQDGSRVVNGRIKSMRKRDREDRATMAAEREAKAKRRALLSNCDWTQVPDAPVDAQAWRDYRQQLRDITDQSGYPHDIKWPEEPGKGSDA